MRRVLLLLPLAAACGTKATTGAAPVSDAGTQMPPEQMVEPAIVYHRDVKAIVDARCGTCHVEGGIGTMPLTTYEQVKTWREPIKQQVMAGKMPPWHADAACGTYANDRSLSAEEKKTLLDWIELGAPEGKASDASSPLPVRDRGLSRVDQMLPIEGEYLPDGRDDYRCFTLDWPEQTARYVTGYNIVPTSAGIVHHVNIYLIEPGRAQTYRDRQRRDLLPGYACFGGVFDQGVSLLGAWAPGSHGVDFPARSGVQVAPGSVIVLEIHYNTDKAEAAPDQSALLLSLADQVDKRAVVVPFYDFFNWTNDGGMPIPAGVADTMHDVSFDPAPFIPQFAPWLVGTENLLIHSAALHMHYLGKSGQLEIRKENGTTECLLQIPRWDFSWQTQYTLSEPKKFRLGHDRAYLACHWDNTAANQPLIGGEQREPRDVEWGSDSSDEMCIGYLFITEE